MAPVSIRARLGSGLAGLSRRTFGVVLGSALCGLLAGCGPSGGPATPDISGADPTIAVQSQPLPGSPGAPGAAGANQIGTGPVKVALILPLTSGNGTPSVVGTSLRNAAELALSESKSQDVTLNVYDDQSSPTGAQSAAQQAVAGGAQLIIGPLFASSVREVGSIARAAGTPVIAFSTDTSTAAHGVYLLSFLIENEVDRVVNYAAANGRKSIAALIPDTTYGRVAEAEFTQIAARDNLRVAEVEHYQPGAAAAAIKRIAANSAQIDALFVPELADAMPAVATQMKSAGIDPKRIKILGTGVWNDTRVMHLPELQGAWFAAPENTGFAAFAGRYRAKYGSDPTRVATLAYDAVSLAAALARTQGTQPFSDAVLTNPSGFNGADGVFRFLGNGQNQRGLSVLEIDNGTTKVVSPAPRSFGGGGT